MPNDLSQINHNVSFNNYVIIKITSHKCQSQIKMEPLRTNIKKNGAVAIPAKYLKILGLKTGDEVMLLIQEGEIRIVSRLQAVQQAQTIIRRFIPEGRILADELIQDRRAEDQGE